MDLHYSNAQAVLPMISTDQVNCWSLNNRIAASANRQSRESIALWCWLSHYRRKTVFSDLVFIVWNIYVWKGGIKTIIFFVPFLDRWKCRTWNQGPNPPQQLFPLFSHVTACWQTACQIYLTACVSVATACVPGGSLPSSEKCISLFFDTLSLDFFLLGSTLTLMCILWLWNSCICLGYLLCLAL